MLAILCMSFGCPQRVPPPDGAGLVQRRDLVEIPPPQLTVQLFQFNQELQPPFTKTTHE
jgi:hypothetical protein